MATPGPPHLCATVAAVPLSLAALVVRRVPAVMWPVLAACLLATGCGGSGSGHKRFPGGVRPIGSPSLPVNLTGLMARNQRYLNQVKVRCPSPTVTSFPVTCDMQATEVGPPPGTTKRIRLRWRGPYPVAGTVTALGVNRTSRTYEYSLDFIRVP